MDRYFIASIADTERLLRRRDMEDSIFRDGAWHPTDRILKYMVGDDMDVDPITEEQARAKFPRAAFAA